MREASKPTKKPLTYHVGLDQGPHHDPRWPSLGWIAYCERCGWRSEEHNKEFANGLAQGHQCQS